MDTHYDTIRTAMRGVFQELGLVARTSTIILSGFALKRLKQNGIPSERLYRPDQVFVRDPDGILVQSAGPGGGIPGRRPGD